MNSRISIWFCLFALGLFLVPQWAWANLEMHEPTSYSCSMPGASNTKESDTPETSRKMESCKDCTKDSSDCNSNDCKNDCNATACGTLLLHGTVISKSTLRAKTDLTLKSSKKPHFYYLNRNYLEGLKSIWQPPKLFL